MRNPVMVRVRLDDIDRAQFARDSNLSDLQGMASTEVAWVDAEHIDDKMMALFSPSEGGDLLAASNRGFVQSFLGKVLTSGSHLHHELLVRILNAHHSKILTFSAIIRRLSAI